MARYQSLPDRIDTVCTHVSDQTMCLNYGNKTDYNITVANTKCVYTLVGNNNQATWTVPPGVCSIVVELWGPGGGGGGGGNGTACTAGAGGGAGGYVSATLPTVPGCQYSLCVGPVGCYGCCATRGTNGSTTYITGFNAGNICAVGGWGGCTLCQVNNSCFSGTSFVPGATSATSQIAATGAAASGAGGINCHQTIARGGSAAFGGGIGGITTYNSPNNGGQFPGGGGGGSCVRTDQSCGGCGGGGLIKIWY